MSESVEGAGVAGNGAGLAYLEEYADSTKCVPFAEIINVHFTCSHCRFTP